jgi:hypothetical protein
MYTVRTATYCLQQPPSRPRLGGSLIYYCIRCNRAEQRYWHKLNAKFKALLNRLSDGTLEVNGTYWGNLNLTSACIVEMRTGKIQIGHETPQQGVI